MKKNAENAENEKKTLGSIKYFKQRNCSYKAKKRLSQNLLKQF